MQPLALGVTDVLLRCPGCAHVVRDLAMCPAGARVPSYGGEPAMDRVRLALTYRQVRRAVRGPVASAFEVGYGSGVLLRRFLDAGADIAGTDPGALQVDVDPVVRDRRSVGTVPLDQVTEPDGYDLVYGVHVIEHVGDPRAFVRSAARLLRPGGMLLLVTPAGDSDGLRWFGRAWWMLEDPTHVGFFSAHSLATLLRAEGLSEVSVTRPLSDSLAVEAASVVRRALSHRLPPDGVLPMWSTRLLVLVTLPVVLLVRLVRPRSRPALLATARRRDTP